MSGTITGDGTEMLDVGSNKTIIGVGTSATISGFGLDVNGWGPDEVAWGGDLCDPAEKDSFTHVQNVIIRNLSFRNSTDDSVNVQCYSHHVWVDHNTFYPSFDGSVDIKRGSDLVTVSYNRYIGTDKSMLLGHSDSNGAQDTGYLRVTYHHNWFDGSNTRHPRVRFGYAHVYANYVDVDRLLHRSRRRRQGLRGGQLREGRQDDHGGLRRHPPDLDEQQRLRHGHHHPGQRQRQDDGGLAAGRRHRGAAAVRLLGRIGADQPARGRGRRQRGGRRPVTETGGSRSSVRRPGSAVCVDAVRRRRG